LPPEFPKVLPDFAAESRRYRFSECFVVQDDRRYGLSSISHMSIGARIADSLVDGLLFD
jgi:hypothetical protein